MKLKNETTYVHHINFLLYLIASSNAADSVFVFVMSERSSLNVLMHKSGDAAEVLHATQAAKETAYILFTCSAPANLLFNSLERFDFSSASPALTRPLAAKRKSARLFEASSPNAMLGQTSFDISGLNSFTGLDTHPKASRTKSNEANKRSFIEHLNIRN